MSAAASRKAWLSRSRGTGKVSAFDQRVNALAAQLKMRWNKGLDITYAKIKTGSSRARLKGLSRSRARRR